MKKRWKYLILLWAIGLAVFFFIRFLVTNDKGAEERIMSNESDLPAILKRGKLRVLAENSATSFFIYRGKQMGFEYEILREFSDFLGVELEIIRVSETDDVDRMLNEGKGDIIACNYGITRTRRRNVAFSLPYFKTREVLVQRKADGSADPRSAFVQEPLQLACKTIDVRPGSAHYDRLISLQNEIGDSILIRAVNGNQGDEELMEMVADGQIDLTIADENLAAINRKFYDNLDISVPVSFRHNVAFGVQTNAPLLRNRLNRWLRRFVNGERYAYITDKYFGEEDVFPALASGIRNGELSPFDAILKREASKYNFDWRLLAAIIQHESNFNPDIRGFGGAYGLMQFMPGVGSRYDVYPGSMPEEQIAGGMRCIRNIAEQWPEVTNRKDKYAFILASYNAGSSHIKDAQRLAKKHGYHPAKWKNNVELMVRNLGKSKYYNDPVVQAGSFRGGFTARYVNEIMSRYALYEEMYE
jgi:membrane-bound lytic murein transglycosylase F